MIEQLLLSLRMLMTKIWSLNKRRRAARSRPILHSTSSTSFVAFWSAHSVQHSVAFLPSAHLHDLLVSFLGLNFIALGNVNKDLPQLCALGGRVFHEFPAPSSS